MRLPVSGNGPCTTLRLSPEKRMRAPLLLACNPAPSTMTPALTNSSLNFAIAPSISSDGILPASESLLALTITMKRIVPLLCARGAHPLPLCPKDEPAVQDPTVLDGFICGSLPRSVSYRGVSLRPKVDENLRWLRRIHRPLRQQDADQIVPRIDIAGGAVTAVPAIAAGNGRQIIAPRVHRAAKSPAAIVSKEQLGASFLLGGQVVGHHQLDRCARENVRSAMPALVQQHAAESQIVVRRRHQFGAARLEHRGLGK